MSKNSYQAALDEVVKTLDTIDQGWKDIDKTILSASKNIRKISSKGLDSGLPKDVDDRIQKQIKERENILTAIEKQRLAELKLQKDRENAFDKYEAQLKSEQASRELQVTKESSLRANLEKQKQSQFTNEVRRAAQQAKGDARQVENQRLLSRNAREAAVLGSKLASEYQKQEVILTQLRRSYKDLALTKGTNTKEAKRLLKEITELDRKLKNVDASVGQFQRNVGNYSSAFKSLGGVLRSTASAFGIMTGSFLAASIIKNGVSRIREFDKEMQNMAGVTRSSRGELADLEKTIISVAGSSVMTSNQVAKLATSLLVLGKTKSEVIALLKPANDLGIALNTTSEEAGEFLVQSLNSFGKSAESAAEFADIIATVRTSTSLDFQKMRDSFQYLSPISRALGKDLAYTGAIIGILADNGLKAESAGRLLGTAQQKLAKEGRSLNEALDAINDAQKEGKSNLEVLALASRLFGAQAGKVGIILANNTDIIETNAQAIRDNGGALDDLVDQQLESLDAKIKILDSTWEEFLLSMENGQGTIATFFKSAIERATQLIKLFQQMGDGGAYVNGEAYKKALKSQADYYKELGDEADAFAEKDYNNSLDRVDNIEAEIKKLQERNSILNAVIDKEKAKTFGNLFTINSNSKEVTENENNIKKLNASLGTQAALRDAAAKQLGIDSDALKENTIQTEENTDTVEKAGRTYSDVLADITAAQKELKGSTAGEADEILDRIDALNKEKDAWERSAKSKKDHEKAIKEARKEEFEVDQSRFKRAIEIEKEITEKKDIETDLRLEANARMLQEQLELLELEKKFAIANAEGRVKVIQKINEDYEHDRRKLIGESEEKTKKIFADDFKKKMLDFKNKKDADSQALDEEITALRQGMLEKGATIQEIEGAIEKAKYDSSQRQLQDQIDFITEELKLAAMSAEEQLEVEKELHKLKKQLLDEEYEVKKNFAEKEKELNKELKESKKEMYAEFQNLAYEAVNGIFTAEVQKYDERIQANNDFFDALLNKENLTEEAREDIEKDRVAKEAELQKKKEEVEKRAFLVQQGMRVAEIAIDTIQKVAAIKATASVLASNPLTVALAPMALAQIPIVIGTGAAAAGTILAQSIPAFEKGKGENDPYEGPMLWGEKRPEVKVDGKGNVEVATKPTFGTTKKGDRIFPSVNAYLDSINMDALNHAAIMTSLHSQARNLDQKETGQVLTDQIEKAIYKGYDKVKAPAVPAPDYNKLAYQIAKEMTLNNRANV